MPTSRHEGDQYLWVGNIRFQQFTLKKNILKLIFSDFIHEKVVCIVFQTTIHEMIYDERHHREVQDLTKGDN
jgi:hypothetical protein